MLLSSRLEQEAGRRRILFRVAASGDVRAQQELEREYHVRRAADRFLHRGKELFHLLHADDDSFSDFDLQLLRSQLHLLEIQITNIQAFRELRLKDGETATYLEQLRRGD